MTDILEPHKKVKWLRQELWNIKDKRLINDKLKEIQHECTALEIQNVKLTMRNRRLVHQANQGKPDVAGMLGIADAYLEEYLSEATQDITVLSGAQAFVRKAQAGLAPQEDVEVPF